VLPALVVTIIGASNQALRDWEAATAGVSLLSLAFFTGYALEHPTARTMFFNIQLWIIAAVFAEGVVLLINKGRCPLTPWAERHTDDRRPNFDIYLPVWLAKWNKWIFTLLFALGLGVALWREFAGV